MQALVERGLWVRPELRKRDIVMFRDSRATDEDAALVIESKVLYSSDSPSKQRSQLEKLTSQLQQAASAYPNACVVGLVVYFEWSYRSANDNVGWVTPRRSAGQRPFIVRSAQVKLGLENAFGQGKRRFTDQNVRMGTHEYKVGISLEIVRLAA